MKVLGALLLIAIGLVVAMTVGKNWQPNTCNPPYHAVQANGSQMCCKAYVNGKCS